jgi:hypothetical protein
VRLSTIKRSYYANDTSRNLDNSWTGFTVVHNMGRAPKSINVTVKIISTGLREPIPDFCWYPSPGNGTGWYLEPTLQPVDFNNSFYLLLYHTVPFAGGPAIEVEINMEWY